MNEDKERVRMMLGRQIRGVLFACTVSAVLAGCGSTEFNNRIVDSMPASIAIPTDAPARPEAAPAYPAVHDMPAPRGVATLSAEEQEKLEHDLVALRGRQEAASGVTPAAKRKPAPVATPAPPRIIPTNNSTNSIY
jgi:hypothetical protein